MIPKRRHNGKNVGVLTTPGKRKLSFSQPEPSPFDDGTASTAQRKVRRVESLAGSNFDAVTIPRLHTLTGMLGAGKKQHQNRRQRNNSLSRCDPKQSTLSMFWKKDGILSVSQNKTASTQTRK